MRRADRLFQIVQHLRLRSGNSRSRTVTALELARKLQVSERTVYRDIQDLGRSGVPIEGEAGVGYILRNFDIPPLMFTREEIEALVIGARMVDAWTTESLAEAGRQALDKIEAALPPRLKQELATPRIYALDFRTKPEIRERLETIRLAIHGQRRLNLHYVREDGGASRRPVQPLGLYFWGSVWTLAAWCEIRNDFRNFRLDRIESMTVEETFEALPGRMLADFLNALRHRHGDLSTP